MPVGKISICLLTLTLMVVIAGCGTHIETDRRLLVPYLGEWCSIDRKAGGGDMAMLRITSDSFEFIEADQVEAEAKSGAKAQPYRTEHINTVIFVMSRDGRIERINFQNGTDTGINMYFFHLEEAGFRPFIARDETLGFLVHPRRKGVCWYL